MSNQTATIEALLAQFQVLGNQLAALQTAKPAEAEPTTVPTARQLASTAAERIRQYVVKHGMATMPELQKALKLEKSSTHYYGDKLAAEARLKLKYERHEASHSLVKQLWEPTRLVEVDPKRFPVTPTEADVEAMLATLESRQLGRSKTG